MDKSLFNKMKWTLGTVMFYILRIFPVKNNKVLIVNSYGSGYGDNAKYISKELEKDGKFEIVWAVRNMSEKFPEGIRRVKYKSIRYYYDMVTAKFWIDNCRKFVYDRKRRNQFYIQTWHGDLGMKKIEKDAEQVLDEKYLMDAHNDSKLIDVFVSGNKWFSDIIRNAFWYDGDIKEFGSPRRDILYASEEVRSEIKRKIGIPQDVKIFLYAPTFRATKNETDFDVYKIDWYGVKDALEKKFGGKWQGMIRLHPNLAPYYDQMNIVQGVIDVNKYPDMQELLMVADCCISDYSSCLFEFSVTGKPGFVYAEDLEQYRKDRDLYFDFDIIPFTVAQSNQELINAILNFNESDFSNRCNSFFKGNVCVVDDGNASRKIVELMRKEMARDEA